MTDTRARFRYAPETAVVESALLIVALVTEAILAAHIGILDEHPPPSRERRLAIGVLQAADRLTREGLRYLHHTRDLAATPSDPRQLEMF